MDPHRSNTAKEQNRRLEDHVAHIDSNDFLNLLTGPEAIEGIDVLLPKHRVRLFPPQETLAMFLAQVLSADGSCQEAVDDAVVKRLIAGLEPCSSNTAAYCKARIRLPQAMIETLVRDIGGCVSGVASEIWLWQGRRVVLADGTTLSLPDTEANQAAYPQSKTQKPGLGFPVLRTVVLMCLSSGALLNAASGPCAGKGSDEQTLFRWLLDTLQCGDVLLGDAFFPTYFLLCELVRRGIDGVFEQFGARRRSTDFSLGERLGSRDHIIVWNKPKRPDWMSPEEYEAVADTLTVRELATGGKILVTTLLSEKKTPKHMVKALYLRRWDVEVNIRDIKATMKMNPLRARTPEMVRKELWVYWLGYNLIRWLMVQAAQLTGRMPHQLSFKHCVQVCMSWQKRSGQSDKALMHDLLLLIAQPRVGLRPGRIEPRQVKRRAKTFPLMTKPRAQAREHVRINGHPKKSKPSVQAAAA
jgi:hypothetical protein